MKFILGDYMNTFVIENLLRGILLVGGSGSWAKQIWSNFIYIGDCCIYNGPWLLLLIYFKLSKLQNFLQKQLQNCGNTTCIMLIKVNFLIYKTKINVKIKLKIKITYVLIMSISLYQGKSNRKTNKKQALVMDCYQNLVPTWNEIRVNQLTPNPPDFRGNKNQLIHPNLSHNKAEFFQQSVSDWLIFILFYLYLYK